MLEEFLPYFSMSFSEHAFVTTGLLNLFLPTTSPPEDDEKLHLQYYLPTLFHLWSMVNRSMMLDIRMLDIFSRQARDCLTAEHLSFGHCGLFTEEQTSTIFTAVLRLLEIPVGQATTPYSATVDVGAGQAILLDRDPRKHPSSHSPVYHEAQVSSHGDRSFCSSSTGNLRKHRQMASRRRSRRPTQSPT